MWNGGTLGTVRAIRTIRQGGLSVRNVAIGVIEDLATHDLDIAQWIGRSGFRDLCVTANAIRDPEHEDIAVIAGRLEKDIIVSHYVDRISPMRRRITEVSGSLGLAIADTVTPGLTLHLSAEGDPRSYGKDAEARTARPRLLTSQPLRLELQALRDAVVGGPHARDIVPLAEALRTVECVAWLRGQVPWQSPEHENAS